MKHIEIYTDGACSGNPGPGGWGAILRFRTAQKVYEKELSGGEANTTNNRMEMTALLEALRQLKEPCAIDLYSDSKYVIDSLQKGWARGWRTRGWKKADKSPALNPDLWAPLLAESEKHEITYHWLKGHAGHPENERCDRMAVELSTKSLLPGFCSCWPTRLPSWTARSLPPGTMPASRWTARGFLTCCLLRTPRQTRVPRWQVCRRKCWLSWCCRWASLPRQKWRKCWRIRRNKSYDSKNACAGLKPAQAFLFALASPTGEAVSGSDH